MSILLKATCVEMKIDLPVWTFPLLSVKPSMTFCVFVLMVRQVGSMEALDDILNNAQAFYPTAVAIGFGDITAITNVGRLRSVILGLYGIIVVALITSIIINYYGEMKRENPGKKSDGTYGWGMI